MKKRFMSVISKLTLGVLLFTGAASTAAKAAGHYPGDKVPVVKYLGTSEDAVLFNVSLENPTGTKFIVMVLDEDNTPLFQEVYTDKKFDKRFKLPKSEKNKLTFVIRNFKDADIKESFEINTHYVEDVVVTKL
ncbi:MAG TPA: hypothetical protein VMI12_06505 [Puia sp.]|nr:hypothetical protein [Puia sp.]